jgi:hypothetical protein
MGAVGREAPVPRARGTATFLAAGCLFAVAGIGALVLGGDHRVNILVLLMIWTVAVLLLVGAARYLIGGPRRVVPVRRVLVLAAGIPALALIVVAILP